MREQWTEEWSDLRRLEVDGAPHEAPEAIRDDELARLVWNVAILRRARTAAIRAIRSTECAPLEVVVASSHLHRRR